MNDMSPVIAAPALDTARMFELVSALAEAKGRQDVPAALAVCHDDMTLDSPPFGSVARGLAENERALIGFFALFPDYGVEVHGYAGDGQNLSVWGLVRMTMAGERFGLASNGRRTEVPVAMQFTFKDDKVLSERFLLDLATVCDQSGVSTDLFRNVLTGGR